MKIKFQKVEIIVKVEEVDILQHMYLDQVKVEIQEKVDTVFQLIIFLVKVEIIVKADVILEVK